MRRKAVKSRRPFRSLGKEDHEFTFRPVNALSKDELASKHAELVRQMDILVNQMISSGRGVSAALRELARFVEANGWEIVEAGPSTINEPDSGELLYLKKYPKVC